MNEDLFKFLVSIGTTQLQFAILFRKVCNSGGDICDLPFKDELIRRAVQDLVKRIELHRSSTQFVNASALCDMLNDLLKGQQSEQITLGNGRSKVGSDVPSSPVESAYDYCAACTELPCRKPFDKELRVIHHPSGNITYERCEHSRAGLSSKQRTHAALQAGIPARFITSEPYTLHSAELPRRFFCVSSSRQINFNLPIKIDKLRLQR